MKFLMLWMFLVCLLVNVNSSLAEEPAYEDSDPKLYHISKRASEIDPRAKEHPEIGFVFKDAKGKVQDLQHATVDTSLAPRNQLVIWLMGHNQGLFDRVAGYGLHGIQVHYANRWFSGLGREKLNDGTSIGKVRLEAATGEDFSPDVSIPKPDGMKERAFQFVKWLAKEHPQGNWSQFLNLEQDGLRWDRVIVAGISHGSTTAARFAKHQKVARVVAFSGPRDQLETWHAFKSATPSNRYFGFTHILDGGWTGDHYCRSWELLGLHKHGAIVDVDKAKPLYKNTRRLITNNEVNNNPGRAHTTVVPGGSAVKDKDGKYLHEPVWRYLFTHPVDKTGTAVGLDPGCLKDQRK